MYPTALEKLIEYFKTLPSVGQKTAERYAMAVLEMPDEVVGEFAEQLAHLHQNVRECSICGNLCEKDVCEICADQYRDSSTICVVQQPKDAIAIEKIGQYKGVYHILHGAISTTKGILPEDINVDNLFKRINEKTKEVIIATNSTLEGDTTALYLTKRLKEFNNIVVTRLASGLPMGGNLDYTDEVTLMRALQGRIKQ